MSETDPDFTPIETRIRDNVGRQGFMGLVGAEVAELSRGTCTLAVDRRPELLQQHGLFHGGVTAFLVDNATTIAAATSRGQPALTAEYKLNLLSPASDAFRSFLIPIHNSKASFFLWCNQLFYEFCFII